MCSREFYSPILLLLGFGYVSIVSQFFAFFAWYQGLAIGGVARVSQIQLLQPFLTIIASALLLGEAMAAPAAFSGIAPITIAAATIVFISVVLGKKAAVKRQSITQ